MRIDEIEGALLEKIESAVAHRDYDQNDRWNALARRLAAIKVQLELIERELTGRATNGTARIAMPPGTLELEITQGDVNQSLLRVTELRHAGLVPSDGNDFLVSAVCPNEEFHFKTQVDQNHSRLRSRSEIASFYRKNAIKAGDRVLWEEVGDRKYRISKL